MVGEIAIADRTLYNDSMAKSLLDKAFFMDKLDDSITTIVDYGCADGTLILFLAKMFPTTYFIGYDLDVTMLKKAVAKLNEEHLDNVTFYSEFEEVVADEHVINGVAALNMSSVIHEVYSYSSENSIRHFWHQVNYGGFKYLIIRDMCLDSTAHRAAMPSDILKIKAHFYDIERLAQFEAIHGSIADNYNLIHFLLKYRYQVNWEREVNENYLPLTVATLMQFIDTDKYELTYIDHYVLPYIANIVKEDFDITIKDNTHLKLIYKLRD